MIHFASRRTGDSSLRVASLLSSMSAFLLVAFAGIGAARAESDLVVKTSRMSVKATIDALADDLTKKGISVLARIDHAAGAKAAGMSLPPTELIIFGNPKLGTPLMQSNRLIGLDLPMKVLAYEDADGSVKIAYTAPAALSKRFGVGDKAEIVVTMSKALDKLTSALEKPAASP